MIRPAAPTTRPVPALAVLAVAAAIGAVSTPRALAAEVALAAPITEADVRAALARTPAAKWTARPSPLAKTAAMSGATPAEYLGGAAEEDDAGSAGTASALFAEVNLRGDRQKELLPPRFDWRDRGGVSYLPPPAVAQGKCGACVSFAIVSALESQLNIACETPSRSFDLSRQHLFSCGGGRCRGGWKLSEAVNVLAEKGVPDTPCLPYLAAAGEDVACAAACVDQERRAVKGVSFSRPTSGVIDVDRIKRALLRGPLIANLILFEDLEFYGGGVYRHVTGNQLGSHAVVLVGWDDADKAWIARNSWGSSWGEAGYFRVAWDDTSLPGRYTWLLDVSLAKLNGICQLPR